MASAITPDDIARLQGYLQKTFSPDIKVIARPRAKDSAEVLMGEEHIALIYRDDEDGETSFLFEMAILEEDL